MSNRSIYSEVKLCRPGTAMQYEADSPWKTSDVSFQLVNCAFPVMHIHEYYEIPIVTGDPIVHVLGGEKHRLKQGDAWLIRPNDNHSLQNDPKLTKDYRLINFMIKPEYFKKFAALVSPDLPERIDSCGEELRFTLDGVTLTSLMNACVQLLTIDTLSAESKESQGKFLFFRLFSEFYDQVICKNRQYPQWFADFLTKLHKIDYCCLPVNEICAQMSYSYSHFSRIFKTYTGVTLVQYITKIKINYAKELLCYTDMTTLEISSLLNYESLSHFNHTFKNVTGKTPREYKKQHSNADG